MSCTSPEESSGVLQKEHGCRPSKAQIILPQFRQFGAVVKTGWIRPLQLHFVASFRFADDSVGFVVSSSCAMAAVRSAMLFVFVVVDDDNDDGGGAADEDDGFVEALLCTVGFFVSAVFALRVVKLSEIRYPDADGGGLGFFWGVLAVAPVVVVDAVVAAERRWT